MLIQADSVKEALETLEEGMKGTLSDWELFSITKRPSLMLCPIMDRQQANMKKKLLLARGILNNYRLLFSLQPMKATLNRVAFFVKIETFCDKCCRPYQPKFGTGSVKLQYVGPLKPIPDSEHPDDKRYNRPNLKTIRMDDICPECCDKLFETILKGR